jgi:potassium-transporting ATPase KdpC subunit
MRRNLISSVVAVVVFTAALGLVYPLAITGVAQVLPKRTATLARDTHDNPRYFQPRPSGDDYNPQATAFANRGPNQASTAAVYRQRIAAYRKLNGAFPPPDAVETSASGLDPDISHANAVIQARRIARVRGIPLAQVMHLVGDGSRANTTKLNEALDGRS